MNRRQFLIGVAGVGAATAFYLKPTNSGAAYSPYFKALNNELKSAGSYKPQLIVDLDRLDQNINALTNGLRKELSYRVVCKSLPSPDLINYVMQRSASRKLMVFHQPFLNHVAESFPQSDILLGKPLPVKSAHRFYQTFSRKTGFDPSRQMQWLIDTPERLHQYQQLAHDLGLRMRLNLEIDVGLHRGGLNNPKELIQLLQIMLTDPDHLEFAGFMGYDPHVVKIPKLIKSPETAYRESQESYQQFLTILKQQMPQTNLETLCLNGAGSPTFNLHKAGTVANDISAGSCLVKPTDFDLPSLEDYLPAAFIATPVLKKLASTSIPSIEAFGRLLNWWNPNTGQSFFIYGGKWLARYESPAGLRDNPLYGFSTNQQLVNGSQSIKLDVDDHIFLRPTQSEFVFLQFGDLVAIRQGKIVDQWPILNQ